MEYLEINHNLLSAYIDNDVSEEERLLIEVAIENEPRIAWEVATLQQTVSMLNSLSESDFPLFTKPLKTTPLELSPVKLTQTQSICHQKRRHKDLGKLNTISPKIQLDLGFSKKKQTESNVVRSLHQKFKLAQQMFWQLGSPLWRGIAIVGLLLLLLLLGSDLFFSLVPYFKTFLVKAQNTTQFGIITMKSTSTSIGLGIHRTYLIIIYLIISGLTFMSTMLWWRSNPYH